MWIDVVELGSSYQGVDGRCAMPALVGASEGPVLPPHRDGTNLTFGGVVRHAQPSIIEEAREGRPALEEIVDGLTRLAVLGDFSALFTQPSLQSDEERPGLIVDLDAEGNVVGLEILDASLRVADPRAMEFSAAGEAS